MSKIRTATMEEIFGQEFKDIGILNDVPTNVQETMRLTNLVPFLNHLFRLYDGERLEAMKSSISELDIINPLVVRPLENGKYEILSGHNRANAAQLIGLKEVPVVIKENLTDDEAMLIVTETNLNQRAFVDMSYSERAIVIKAHYEAIKSQGKRTDIINNVF